MKDSDYTLIENLLTSDLASASMTEMQVINEMVSKEELTDIDDVIKRLQACKRALAIANTLPTKEEDGGGKGRSYWKGQVFANLNRVRAALVRLEKDLKEKEGLSDEDTEPAKDKQSFLQRIKWRKFGW